MKTTRELFGAPPEASRVSNDEPEVWAVVDMGITVFAALLAAPLFIVVYRVSRGGGLR